jgi:hypothetical protein
LAYFKKHKNIQMSQNIKTPIRKSKKIPHVIITKTNEHSGWDSAMDKIKHEAKIIDQKIIGWIVDLRFEMDSLIKEAKEIPMSSNGKATKGGIHPGFDIDKAVNFLNEHAYPKYDKNTCGYCARAIRKALEAGGLNTANRPNSAKDYGPLLLRLGFQTISSTNYTPLKGDIRVFQSYPGGGVHGHINMYNGNQWISDFRENGFWPGPGYREYKPSFGIFRWGTYP